ncbi:hypothetical protein MBLNU459_g0940t1 [Dothideomycetes sp. NU459]
MVQLPSPFSEISRYQLLYLQPSAIEPLDNLTKRLASSKEDFHSPRFWIKREDSNSGLAGGGNKIRKLEYVLPDAQAENATVLIATDISMVDKKLADVSQALRDKGETPYWVPSGASTDPLGGLGYARSAFEIIEQEAELGVHFGHIFVACNGGSTLGGMIAGFQLFEQQAQHKLFSRKVIGIDTSAGNENELKALVLDIARNSAAKIGVHDANKSITEDSVLIDCKWNAGVCGTLNHTTRDAIKLLATTEGVLLDPVYTGKAFAGMRDWAQIPTLQLDDSEQGNFLFIHTGGTAVLNAYPDLA